MERYKKTLNRRIQGYTLLLLLAAAIGVYDTFFASATVRESEIWQFQIGLLLGLGLVASIIVLRTRRIVNNPDQLQLEMNKAQDERLQHIRDKAGLPVVRLISLLILVAGIIAGYWNKTVFITLVTTAVAQLLIVNAIRFYYLRRI